MGVAQHIMKDNYIKMGDEVHKTLQYVTVGRSTNCVLNYLYIFNKMFYTILSYLQHELMKPGF
jgi:hypothetical protein